MKKIEYLISKLDSNSLPLEIDENVLNLGLSHGIPAYLIILAKFSTIISNNKIIQKLIDFYFNLLFSCQINEKISIYPSQIRNYGSISPLAYPTRLAWCYGVLAPLMTGHNST